MTCSECGQRFRSESAFDMHRVGSFEQGHVNRRGTYKVDRRNTRHCLTPAQMRAKGMDFKDGSWRSTSGQHVAA